MIVWASAALMSYEIFATLRGQPTITALSHRRPYSYIVWGWLVWLFLHLATEAIALPPNGAKL